MGYTNNRAVGGLGFGYLGFELTPPRTVSTSPLVSSTLLREKSIVSGPALAPAITPLTTVRRYTPPGTIAAPPPPPEATPPPNFADDPGAVPGDGVIYDEYGPPGPGPLPPAPPQVRWEGGHLPRWALPVGLGAAGLLVLYLIRRRRRPAPMAANRRRRRR